MIIIAYIKYDNINMSKLRIHLIYTKILRLKYIFFNRKYIKFIHHNCFKWVRLFKNNFTNFIYEYDTFTYLIHKYLHFIDKKKIIEFISLKIH